MVKDKTLSVLAYYAYHNNKPQKIEGCEKVNNRLGLYGSNEPQDDMG